MQKLVVTLAIRLYEKLPVGVNFHPVVVKKFQIRKRLADAFHRAHEEQYGFAERDRTIELVAVRTADVRRGPALELPRSERTEVTGPSVLELPGSTCWIPPGWVGARDGRMLRLTRT